jgi:hypothetical protein
VKRREGTHLFARKIFFHEGGAPEKVKNLPRPSFMSEAIALPVNKNLILLVTQAF